MIAERTGGTPGSAPGSQASPTVAPAVTDRFLRAVVERDYPGLAACFAADARFRALVPRGLREARGTDEPARYFQLWFGSADRVEMLGGEVTPMADRQHLAWRLRVHETTGARLVEQQAYATIQDDRIAELDLLCSGFRHEPAPEEPAPEPAARLDGVDAGCATLTPLVGAKLRGLRSGEVLEIVIGEATAAQDLAAWSALTGHAIVAVRTDGGRPRFYVRKK